MKRCLILNLEISALNPEFGDIVHFRAKSFSDPEDDFGEWVKLVNIHIKYNNLAFRWQRYYFRH